MNAVQRDIRNANIYEKFKNSKKKIPQHESAIYSIHPFCKFKQTNKQTNKQFLSFFCTSSKPST